MDKVANNRELRLISVWKWFVAGLLWCYIIYRAVVLEITQDEAYSYFLVKTNYWKALVGTTNTHWLNSIFIKFFITLPGDDLPWKLRILSMLSWPLYCFSAIRLSALFKSKWLGVLFFLFALLNPFLIFYFSIARGYAAACAFIMLTLWQATKALWIRDLSTQTWFLIFVWASVAVIANFSGFYFFASLTTVYIFYAYLNNQLNKFMQLSARRLHYLIAGVSIFTITELLFIKFYTGELEFFGKTYLSRSMFASLIYNGVYASTTPTVLYWGGLFIYFVFAIALVIAFYRTFNVKKTTPASFFMFVLLVILLMNICFNTFFKTPYLIERTALILYPVLLTGLLQLLDSAKLKRWVNALLIQVPATILIVLLLLNFYKGFSPFYFKEWTVQTNTNECLKYLKKNGVTKAGLHFWHYSVYVNYYRLAFSRPYDLEYEIIDRNEISNIRDTAKFSRLAYLVLAPPDTNLKQLPGNWKVKLNFPQSGTKLVFNTTFETQ